MPKALLKRKPSHLRTANAYVETLADNVSLDDWAEIVRTAKDQAIAGDSRAREWLSSYLMGAARAEAPSTATVIIQNVQGRGPVVDALEGEISRERAYPSLKQIEQPAQRIRAKLLAELADVADA